MQLKFSVLFPRFRCALLLMILFLGSAAISGCRHRRYCQPRRVGGKTVTTEFGSVRGYASSGAWIYKGIPYAAPPVGDLRWRAPQDPDTWKGVRDTTKPASVCTQQIYTQQWVPASPAASAASYTGSEDCLYLDIYRPQSKKTDLPVFVWIHGGANNFGGATSYDGSTLAVRENMIVVVVQYRLAALGWFSNYALETIAAMASDSLDFSGNYGTLDQIKALTWVQHNIAAFGGDPSKVTVGGQSAGGNATLNMLVSPLTTGLFSKAAAFSPAMPLIPLDTTNPSPLTLSNLMIDWLLQDDGTVSPTDWSGADTYRLNVMADPEAVTLYLRSKTAIKILEACIEANYYMTGQEIMPFHSPYMDGLVLPSTDWITAISSGNYHPVPLLVGNVEYEDKSFMPLYGPAFAAFGVPSTAPTYSWLNLLYGVLIPSPTALSLSAVLATPTDQYIYDTVGLLSSEMWKAKYTDAVADALMTNNSSNSIYAYLFRWNGGGDPAVANFAFIYGAGHAQDVPFWFGQYNKDTFGLSFTATNRPGRVLLIEHS